MVITNRRRRVGKQFSGAACTGNAVQDLRRERRKLLQRVDNTDLSKDEHNEILLEIQQNFRGLRHQLAGDAMKAKYDRQAKRWYSRAVK